LLSKLPESLGIVRWLLWGDINESYVTRYVIT